MKGRFKVSVTVKNTESKITSAKRTITVKDAIVKELRFVDEAGDVTEPVIEQIPDNYDTIDVKISVEIDSDEDV